MSVLRQKSGGHCRCAKRWADMSKILVIEDNPDNMELAVFLLRSAGHIVSSAIDAEAGLALAREVRPDLILMDIQLPGMDGLEVTRLLKRDEATRTIPVVALTALVMKGDEERIRAAGCDGYIGKPIGVQNFLATIAAQLGITPISAESSPHEAARDSQAEGGRGLDGQR